jgi:uncharacterized protein (TIGR02598 family)
MISTVSVCSRRNVFHPKCHWNFSQEFPKKEFSKIFMKIHNLIKRLSTKQAFSLVEVTLAVGIAGLGITVMLGLLPFGMENLRQAGQSLAYSRTFQQMIGEIQAADWGAEMGGTPPWERLQAYSATPRRFFDTEGTPVEQGSPGWEERVSYVAEYEFPAVQVQLPGATTVVQNDLVRLIVRVATTPNVNYTFTGTADQEESRAFSVARQSPRGL